MVTTTALPRVRPSIPQAVRKYKACARTPYLTMRNPVKSVGSAAVLSYILGAFLAPGFMATILSSMETLASTAKIIINKVKPLLQKKPTIPLDKGFIPRTLAVLGNATGGALLHFTTLFAAKAIGSVALIAGLSIVVAGAVKRLIGKRSSVKQLSKLIKSQEDLAKLDQELQKQEVPPDIKLQLFRKLEQKGVVV